MLGADKNVLRWPLLSSTTLQEGQGRDRVQQAVLEPWSERSGVLLLRQELHHSLQGQPEETEVTQPLENCDLSSEAKGSLMRQKG